MNSNGWNRVARLEDLSDGIPVSVTVDKAKILLVRLGETVYAFKGKCPHYGAPLSKGLLCGKELTCPWHNARFDITTGKLKAPPALNDLSRFQVRVENGEIYIRRPAAASGRRGSPSSAFRARPGRPRRRASGLGRSPRAPSRPTWIGPGPSPWEASA